MAGAPVPAAAHNGNDPYLAQLRDDLAAGRVPSYRKVMRSMNVGQERAREVREHLAGILERASRN